MLAKSKKKFPKTTRQLERHIKGISNHRRIEILMLVAREKGISVDGVAEALDCNFKTISEHIRKLVQAGLVNKSYQGRTVTHSLSPYGKVFHNFIMKF